VTESCGRILIGRALEALVDFRGESGIWWDCCSPKKEASSAQITWRKLLELRFFGKSLSDVLRMTRSGVSMAPILYNSVGESRFNLAGEWQAAG